MVTKLGDQTALSVYKDYLGEHITPSGECTPGSHGKETGARTAGERTADGQERGRSGQRVKECLFLATMSHEIRTPMNAIIGLSNLALKNEITPKLRDYLTKISDSAHSLLRIINDILDFSKIEAGRMELERRQFFLEEVLDMLSNVVCIKAEEKGLDLLFRVAHDVPLELVGDPLRLCQLQVNLTNNAVKFTNAGQIVVDIRPAAAKCLDNGHRTYLTFSIEDTGIGLTKEQLDKLFRPFTQADGSTTRKYGGTGLGLAICKRLTEMMGGEMDGYDVCKRLKEDERTKDIPIIFITAMSEVDNEMKGFELGAVDYITKPVHPALVKARVKTHLRLKRKTDLLESLVSIDGLTEIPNRRRFDELIAIEWRRARRNQTTLTLMMMDIDYFKRFNDNYGHASGDECLKAVAVCLKRSMKRASDFVARFGGEEFAALFPDLQATHAPTVAQRFCSAIEALQIPYVYSEVAQYVTLSIGVATTVPSPDSSHQSLIEQADTMLYKAKNEGRNQIAYV